MLTISMSHYEVFYIYSVQNSFICSVQISFSILLPHFLCFYPSIRTMQQIKRLIIYSKYTFLIPSIQLHVLVSIHNNNHWMINTSIYTKETKKGCDLILRFRKKEGDCAVQ